MIEMNPGCSAAMLSFPIALHMLQPHSARFTVMQ